MASEINESDLFKQMANDARFVKAYEQHKKDDAEYGNPVLPAGIEGGVAQLSDIKIGRFESGNNKGQLYFMASGICKSPATHEGKKTRGLRTQIGPEPLCDTPNTVGKRKTLEDHYAWMLNQIRILGVDTANLNIATLESVFRALRTGKPFFNFRTWKGQKEEIVEHNGRWFAMVGNKTTGGPYGSEKAAKDRHPYAGQEPRITHEWNGRCDFVDEPEAVRTKENARAFMTDQGAATSAQSANGQAQAQTQTQEAEPIQAPTPGLFQPDTTVTAVGSADESNDYEEEGAAPKVDTPEEDLEVLIKQAVSDDNSDAQEALRSIGIGYGLKADVLDALDTWEEVADAVRAAQKAYTSKIAEETAQTQQTSNTGPQEATDGASVTPSSPPQEGVKVRKGDKVRIARKNADGKPLRDKKTKKVIEIECEVVSISIKKQTVELRSGNDTYTDIPIAELLV